MLIRIRNSNLQGGGLNSNYRKQFGGVGDYCMIDTPGGRIPPVKDYTTACRILHLRFQLHSEGRRQGLDAKLAL